MAGDNAGLYGAAGGRIVARAEQGAVFELVWRAQTQNAEAIDGNITSHGSRFVSTHEGSR